MTNITNYLAFSPYELNVISHHKNSDGKIMRQHNVEGINTIGVFGNENFSIQLKNNSFQRIQAKISIDGIDILTGKLADTQASSEMWVVEPYATLSLKAFPETKHGGASFIFTNADNSVAAHVQSNLSDRGIIAAAIFTESNYNQYGNFWFYPNIFVNPVPFNPIPLTPYFSTCSFQITETCITSNILSSADNARQPNHQVAVGAGQYQTQEIHHATGLVAPMLSQTMRIKYEWYDDLVAKLRAQNVEQPQPSGFPGDQRFGIDLKDTPRLGENRAKPPTPSVERFYSAAT